MHTRVRRVAVAVTAVAVVAIAGGVTYAVAEIGGGRGDQRLLQVGQRPAASDRSGDRQL